MTSVRRRNTLHLVKASVLLSLLLLGLINTAGGAQQGARTGTTQTALPTRIGDGEFWNLIATYSEPGGTFSSENFTSNEISIGQLSTELRARGRTGGAYIGVGPEQNFTYIAALRPEVVFIVDIRRQAIMQHLMYKAVFELSQNRSEFIGRLFSMPIQAQASPAMSIGAIWDSYQSFMGDSALYEKNLQDIIKHLTVTRSMALSSGDIASLTHVYNSFFLIGPLISYRGLSPGAALMGAAMGTFGSMSLNTDTAGVERSFLANEDDFQFVKSLHMRNLFIPIVGDFGGPSAIRSVATWLRQHRTIVSAYYVSNVEEYLRPGDALKRYHESALTLPLDSLSLFIRPAMGNPNSTKVSNERFARFQSASGLRGSDVVVQIRDPVSGAMSGTVSVRPPVSTSAAPPPTPVVQNPSLGSITGTVRDSASGAPLTTTSVTVVGTDLTAVTNQDGIYTIANVPPGTHSAQAVRVGYARYTLGDIKTAAGSPTVADVKLASMPIRLTNVMYSAGGFFHYEVVGGTGRPHVPLCPMQPFLAAHTAGLIVAYADVKACVRQ